MVNIVKCPGCQKALKMNDDSAGDQVRCPACRETFVVPVQEPLERGFEVVEEEEQRPARRSRARSDDEDRPRKRRRDREDEEEEDDDHRDRPRRSIRKRRRGRQITAPAAPLILGICACVFSCAPVIGATLGGMAMQKADEALYELPRTSRADAADRQLNLARILGMVGIGLSVFIAILGLILKLTNRF